MKPDSFGTHQYLPHTRVHLSKKNMTQKVTFPTSDVEFRLLSNGMWRIKLHHSLEKITESHVTPSTHSRQRIYDNDHVLKIIFAFHRPIFIGILTIIMKWHVSCHIKDTKSREFLNIKTLKRFANMKRSRTHSRLVQKNGLQAVGSRYMVPRTLWWIQKVLKAVNDAKNR